MHKLGMNNTVRKWNELSIGPLTVEAIRQLHPDASKFRVSKNRYEAGVRFPGTHRTGRMYVLSGACQIRQSHFVAELHAGTFCDFPDGDFEFEVSSNAPVELVSVWKFIFDGEGKLAGVGPVER